MDYKAFTSKAEAMTEIAKMRGWKRPHIAYIYHPEHPLASRKGNIIVIQTGDKFLRESGYIR